MDTDKDILAFEIDTTEPIPVEAFNNSIRATANQLMASADGGAMCPSGNRHDTGILYVVAQSIGLFVSVFVCHNCRVINERAVVFGWRVPFRRSGLSSYAHRPYLFDNFCVCLARGVVGISQLSVQIHQTLYLMLGRSILYCPHGEEKSFILPHTKPRTVSIGLPSASTPNILLVAASKARSSLVRFTM